MGSTGSTRHSFLVNKDSKAKEAFGIISAKLFSGKVPKDSQLEPVGANKVTLRLNTNEKQDILFQFKLTKSNQMSIIAYNPNTGKRARTMVDADRPSLDNVIKNGSSSQARGASAVKDMMSKSSSVSESQLSLIATQLKSRRRN